jgi:hypothetical protein
MATLQSNEEFNENRTCNTQAVLLLLDRWSQAYNQRAVQDYVCDTPRLEYTRGHLWIAKQRLMFVQFTCSQSSSRPACPPFPPREASTVVLTVNLWEIPRPARQSEVHQL